MIASKNNSKTIVSSDKLNGLITIQPTQTWVNTSKYHWFQILPINIFINLFY